jgi:RNA polymerase sigma-70 factor, ECF subfamily
VNKKIFCGPCNNHAEFTTIIESFASVADKDTEKEFERQIRDHEALIHKVCRMYASSEADRQDLFQEIVIHLWKSYPKFRALSKFSTWLYRVAINTAITGLRQQKGMITSFEHKHLLSQVADETGVEEEQWQQLYKAIGQLNEIEKAIVMLYMEDRSYEDMEDILGIAQGNLRVRMTRIKDKLRQLTKNN